MGKYSANAAAKKVQANMNEYRSRVVDESLREKLGAMCAVLAGFAGLPICRPPYINRDCLPLVCHLDDLTCRKLKKCMSSESFGVFLERKMPKKSK